MAEVVKATIVMTPEFIRDLQDGKHPNLARQALKHVFEENGTFKVDRNDHPYDGITDGWIRWVQMGGAGLRVIYIRKSDTIYLYRVVGKSDEDGLSAPKPISAQAAVATLPDDILVGLGESSASVAERVIKNHEPTYLRETLRRMFHAPHSEVILISPTISASLLRVTGEVGRFLDRAIEEGTQATVVTLPSSIVDIPFYEDLARRNIEVYFFQNLRSRLFLFKADEYRRQAAGEAVKPTAVMGSAELTHQSLDIGGAGRNEELCYRFPETHFSAFYLYAKDLVRRSTDLQGHKIKLQGG